MLPFNKDNLVSAYFEDAERQIVTVQYKEDGSDVIDTYTTDVDERNNKWMGILEIIDIQSIHEITHERRKMESRAFREFAINAAIADGFTTETEEQALASFTNSLLTDDPDMDNLFKFKLSLFEHDKIKQLDREFKGKIRKSKTYIDVTRAVIEGLDSLNTNEEASSLDAAD